jgi:hypothetical protein
MGVKGFIGMFINHNPPSPPFSKGGLGGFESNLTKSFQDVKWKEESSESGRERFETVPYRSSEKGVFKL